MIRTVVLAALALVCVASSAEARHRRVVIADPMCNILWPCDGVISSPRGEMIARKVGIGAAQKIYERRSEVIGGRPPGCPHAFCGCGASLHLFGRIIPALNLAANWLKFPRAEPAPKMAAARSHHVMVLEQHISGNIWLVHDSNSGGGLTRLHARSIAGYIVVNPHG